MNPRIIPSVHYTDAEAAITWLKQAFGFEEKLINRNQNGIIHHAELKYNNDIIMVGQISEANRPGSKPIDPLASPAGIYIIIENPDEHYAKAKAAGAEIVRELAESFGSYQYSARDIEGNFWTFGTYDPFVES